MERAIHYRGALLPLGAAYPTNLGVALVGLPDRWGYRDNSVGAIVATSSRQAGFAPGSQWCLRHQVAAGTTNLSSHSLVQDVGTLIPFLSRGSFALSAFGRAGADFAAKSTFQVLVQAGTGTNEARRNVNYVGQTSPLVQNLVPPTAATFYSFSFLIPAGTTEIGLIFLMVGTATPSGAADYYELDNVQLELGGQLQPLSCFLLMCSWIAPSSGCRRVFRMRPPQ